MTAGELSKKRIGLHFLARHPYPRWIARSRPITSLDQTPMTLKIDKISEERGTVIRLIGRLQREHLGILTKQIQSCTGEITLDLGELSLINLEGVRFLIACQDRGIGVSNASPYVADWMRRERMPTDDDSC